VNGSFNWKDSSMWGSVFKYKNKRSKPWHASRILWTIVYTFQSLKVPNPPQKPNFEKRNSGREWRVGSHQNVRTSQEIFPASVTCKQHLLIFQSNGIRCPHSPHACMQWAMASGIWICYLHVNLGNFSLCYFRP
jgi:hypothetical protein